MKAWSLEKVLIIVEATDEKLYLASRNLPYVEVLEVTAINPLALASYDKVLMTVAAVKRIEERSACNDSRAIDERPHRPARHRKDVAGDARTTTQYTFRVRREATKPDIKKAVELMFEVKVAGVQVVNEPGKTRRFGKGLGRTQDWKKAYVSLVAGQTIDYEARAKA